MITANGAHVKKSFFSRAGRMAVLVGAPVLVLAGLYYIYRYDPTTQGRKFIPCMTYLFTGLYCPGCGNTRALHAFVHMDFAAMLDNNVFFLPLFLILAWLLAGEYLRLLFGRRILWLPKRVPTPLIILAAVLLAAFTILRNLPFFPFDWLAPGRFG